MKRAIRTFCQCCLPCQRAKIHRYTQARTGSNPLPTSKFEILHLDLVGPLPPASDGSKYLLTIVDRFSRWIEAIPLTNSTTSTVAHTLLHHWICRFGVPTTIITDRGPQFTSNLWHNIGLLLGWNHKPTTAYHPEANALVERTHRTIKDGIRALLNQHPTDWPETLPFVLFAMRTTTDEKDVSPALLTFGSSVRFPSNVLHDTPRENLSFDDKEVLKRTIENLARMRPRPISHHGGGVSHQEYIPPDLLQASHVLVRIDRTKTPLEPRWEGPFPVVRILRHTVIISRNGTNDAVAINRVKPAYVPSSFMPVSPRGGVL